MPAQKRVTAFTAKEPGTVLSTRSSEAEHGHSRRCCCHHRPPSEPSPDGRMKLLIDECLSPELAKLAQQRRDRRSRPD